MRLALLVLLACLSPSAAFAQLEPETVAAFEQYITRLEQDFNQGTGDGEPGLDVSPAALERLRAGEVLAWPAREDGILTVPDGLIHHWRGAVFLPGVSLAQVLRVVQDYDSYESVYEDVVQSSLVGREGGSGSPPGHERLLAFLRLHRSAGGVSGTFDIWTVVDYGYPSLDLATAASSSDCVREVEAAGEPGEQRLPPGAGSGFLWRANTYARYLERDGGVYVDLQTVGLSRGFPPLLGWLIEPIARRLGRSSAADTLEDLREAVTQGEPGLGTPGPSPSDAPDSRWCGETASDTPPEGLRR